MNAAEKSICDVIDQIAKERNYEDYKVTVKPISSGGANFSSNIFRLTLSTQQKEIPLFAKVSVLQDKPRETISGGLYTNEHYFYTNILKRYKGIEQKYGVKEEDRLLTPEFYGPSVEDSHETLVLEDLSARGFKQFNRFESFDWPFASFAIKQLAIFHALSIAYSKEFPAEYEYTVKEKLWSLPMEIITAGIDKGFQEAIEAVKDENKEKLIKWLKNPKIREPAEKLSKPTDIPVIKHTDFRPDNMMHRTLEDGSVQVITLDYQTLMEGSPASDLLNFVMLGSDKNFRNKHLQQCFELYYTEFSAALARFNIDSEKVYSRKMYEAEIKELVPYMLSMCMFTILVVTVDKNDVPKEGENFFDMKPSKLYCERINGLIEDFLDWEVKYNQSCLEGKNAAEKSIRDVINQIAKERNYEDYKVTVKPISSGGANFSSNIFRLTLSTQQKEIPLFAKVSVLQDKPREAISGSLYTNEHYFYTNILKRYKGIEQKYGVKEEHTLLTPEFYGPSVEDSHETLVLEDLSARGFKQFNRFESFDWPFASFAIKQLAIFHALSIAYSKEFPAEYEYTVKEKLWPLPMEIITAGIDKGFQKAIEAVKDENKERLIKWLKNPKIREPAEKLSKPTDIPVIKHTDFRPDNMMHRTLEDGSVQVITLDYQTLMEGSPASDLVNFVMLGSDKNFRNKHLKQCFELYYTEFSAALARFNIDSEKVYSRKMYEAEIKELVPYMLSMCMFAILVVTVDKNDVPKEGENFFDMKPSKLYCERINGLIEDFLDWEVKYNQSCLERKKKKNMCRCQ